MINRLKMTLMVPGLALALAAPAFAQDTTQEGGGVTLNETGTGGETPMVDAPATSQGARYPVKFAARPLTVGKMMLVPGLGINISHVGDTGFGLALGAQFGITDDLEVGATVLPLTLSPGTAYGDIPVYGRFRFLKGNFELGAQLVLSIPTSTDFGLTPSLVGLFHANNLRIDIGAGVELKFTDLLQKILQVPVSFALNFSDNVYGQLVTGLYMPDFDGVAVPLGAGFGYTIGKANLPMIDIGALFTFPGFLVSAGEDHINVDVFAIMITGKFYLFL